MENHHFTSTINYKWSCLIAMLVYPEGMYKQAGEMLPRTVDLDGKIENPGTCDDSGS